MERLPNPPKKFSGPPILNRCSTGTKLWRIYYKGGRHPSRWNGFRFFGPTTSRFDHHTLPKRPQSRGIIYATSGPDAIGTAVVEFFQDTRHIDRFRAEPWLACFELTAPVPLLDTGSEWPVQEGGNMAINSGLRSQSRRWSRRIYREYPQVEGIWYPSSLTNHPCASLYERATHALPIRPRFNMALNTTSLLPGLSRIAAKFNYTMN